MVKWFCLFAAFSLTLALVSALTPPAVDTLALPQHACTPYCVPQ